MPDFEILASFVTHPNHHKLFRSKSLVLDWARTYPMIFDEDDIRIAENQAELGYHFYEWLAAVLLYHTYAYFSLVEQYQFKKHRTKQKILSELTRSNVIEFMRHHPKFGGVQCPDLLVYKPDYSDWFFCEVKGPKDRLRYEQIVFFRELSRVSGKAIRLIEFAHLPEEFYAA